MKSTTLNINLPVDFKREIEALAKKENRSIAGQMRHLALIGLSAEKRRNQEIEKIRSGETQIDMDQIEALR